MIEIETPRLFIRKLQENDRQDLFEILSNEQWCLNGGGYHAFQTMDEQFEIVFQKFLSKQIYAIVLKEEEKLIGIISISDSDWVDSARELGFGINPIYQKNGYCYEALKNVIAIWFQHTEAQMLTTSHYSFNTASQKLITKLGFVYEGAVHKTRHHSIYGQSDLMCYYLKR